MDAKLNPKAAAEALIAASAESGLAESGPLLPIAVTVARSMLDLLAELNRLTAWLERLAQQAERQAAETRHITIREAAAADAKNYRATARSGLAIIAKIEGS